jgi:hypothetical protein
MRDELKMVLGAWQAVAFGGALLCVPTASTAADAQLEVDASGPANPTRQPFRRAFRVARTQAVLEALTRMELDHD